MPTQQMPSWYAAMAADIVVEVGTRGRQGDLLGAAQLAARRVARYGSVLGKILLFSSADGPIYIPVVPVGCGDKPAGTGNWHVRLVDDATRCPRTN